jgi:hypothetical protein
VKYKLISGLKLQYGHTQTPNGIARQLLNGKEVELSKENWEEFEFLGVHVQPIEKKEPKKKVKKEEK